MDLFRQIAKGHLHFPKSSHPDYTGESLQKPPAVATKTRQRTVNTALQPRKLLLKDKNSKRTASGASRAPLTLLNQKNSSLRSSALDNPDPFSSAICYSRAARNLICDLLQVDDTKRIAAAEVLHKYRPWFELHGALLR